MPTPTAAFAHPPVYSPWFTFATQATWAPGHGGRSVTANAMLLVWALGWAALFRSRGIHDSLDVVAFACLVAFPCLCVLAARHLP